MAQFGNVRLPTHWSVHNRNRYSGHLAREMQMVKARDKANPRRQIAKANLGATYSSVAPRHTKHATDATYFRWMKEGRSPWESRSRVEGRKELTAMWKRHHNGIVKARETVGIMERTFDEPFGAYRSDQALARLLELSKVLLQPDPKDERTEVRHKQLAPSSRSLLLDRLMLEPGLDLEVDRLFSEFNSAEVLALKPKVLVDYVRMYRIFERVELDQEGSLAVAVNEALFELQPPQVVRCLSDLLIIGQRRAWRLAGATTGSHLNFGYGGQDVFPSPLDGYSPAPAALQTEEEQTLNLLPLSRNSCQQPSVASYFDGLPLAVRLQVFAPKVANWLKGRHTDRKRQLEVASPKQLGAELDVDTLAKTHRQKRRVALQDELASLAHGGDPLSSLLWYALESARMFAHSARSRGRDASTPLFLATEATTNHVTREPCSQPWVYYHHTLEVDRELLEDYWWSLESPRQQKGSKLTSKSQERFQHLLDFTEMLGVKAAADVLLQSVELPIRKVRAVEWLGSLLDALDRGLNLLVDPDPTQGGHLEANLFVQRFVSSGILSTLLCTPERRDLWSRILFPEAAMNGDGDGSKSAEPTSSALVELKTQSSFLNKASPKFGLQRFHHQERNKKEAHADPMAEAVASTRNSLIRLFATSVQRVMQFDLAVDEDAARHWTELASLVLRGPDGNSEALLLCQTMVERFGS